MRFPFLVLLIQKEINPRTVQYSAPKGAPDYMHSPETFRLTILNCLSEIFHLISFHHRTVFHADDFISFEYILLVADILTADTVIFIFVLIIVHIDVKISHKTHWAAVI